MRAFLRKLENLGVLDLAACLLVIAVAVVATAGISVPVRYQSVSTSIAEETTTQIEAPYCLSEHVVVWGDTYYVAHPGMNLSDSEVQEWYIPFFIDNLGYIPSDIRVISADPSTDSHYSHYVESYNGFIILDAFYCGE